MNDKKIIVFEDKKIRRTWFNDEWWFAIIDIIEILTDSKDPASYLKDMRRRDEGLREGWGQIATPLEMPTAGGRQKINCVSIKGAFRLIQSIPSKRAEPFKLWLAKVGSERIDETVDPEISIDRAMKNYLRQGRSRGWINQRLKSIEVRKELTDEWHDRGVEEGVEFGILTNEMMKVWSGMEIGEYKNFKGLKKENLRDNMTNLELVLNMLAEASTAEISKKVEPENFEENRVVARDGGEVARKAREELEVKIGERVVSDDNYLEKKEKETKKKKKKRVIRVEN